MYPQSYTWTCAEFSHSFHIVLIINFQSLVTENNLASYRILLIHLHIVSFAPNLSLCNSVGPIRLNNHKKLTYLLFTCLKVGCFALNLLKTSVSSRTKDGTRLRFLDLTVLTRRHVAWQVKRDILALHGKMASQCTKISTEMVYS